MPALEVDGLVLAQNPAMLAWIDKTWPEPPLPPPDDTGRATVRAMAAAMACDIHPLHDLCAFRAPSAGFGASGALPAIAAAHPAAWPDAGWPDPLARGRAGVYP